MPPLLMETAQNDCALFFCLEREALDLAQPSTPLLEEDDAREETRAVACTVRDLTVSDADEERGAGKMSCGV